MNVSQSNRRFLRRVTSWFGSHRLPLLALGCITAIGAILRAYHLGFKPLWFDEALFYWIGQRTLPDAITQNALVTSAPPLFPLLIWLVSRISTTEVALRFVPFVAGTLAIPAIYILARRYISVGGALASSIMIAVAPSQVKFSQQVREYSLSVLLGLAILASFGSFLEKRTWRYAIILSLTTIVGIFTHYGLALLVLAVDCVFLANLLRMKSPRRRLFLKWSVAQFFGFAAALAVYFLALRQQFHPVVLGGAGYLQSGFWAGSTLPSAVQFLYDGVRDVMASAFPGYVFTLMLYTGGMVLLLRHWRTPYPYIIAAPILAVAGASLLRLYPLTGDRQDLFLTPLIILVAATALDYMIRTDDRRLLVAVFLSLMVWRAIHSLQDYYPTDGDSAVGNLVKRLADSAAPGDPIYLCLGDDPALRYYVYSRYPLPLNPIIEGKRGPGPRDYIDQVDSMLSLYKRAWMIIFPPCGDMTPLLDHVAKDWTIELIEKRYPDAQLFFVH